tara:strand:+ start:149 stop:373 length:225 start_codon:yes stop_codon:yes gene_type:complete
MIEVIQYISGYLVIGCVWILWFERFCINHKIGGAFTNQERYTQMLLWPLNLAVFLYSWFEEIIKDITNGGPRHN